MEIHPDVVKAMQTHLANRIKQGKLYSEARGRYSSERNQRTERAKGDNKRLSPVFLRPKDIERGLEYDIEKVFLTTLGVKKGEPMRRVTQEDLKAFTKNIERVKNQYKGGITARQVINMALPIDVERANTEIFTAVTLGHKDGVFNFMTNASKGSKAKYHYVNVQFLKYTDIVSQAVSVTEDKLRTSVLQGKLKFECDCGRHRFWYRYMATIGKYGYGREEYGFPKIRNPNLSGVACKHVLRVMQYIQSPMFRSKFKAEIDKVRAAETPKAVRHSAKKIIQEMDKHIEFVASGAKKAGITQNKMAVIRMVEQAERRVKNKVRDEQRKIEANLRKITNMEERRQSRITQLNEELRKLIQQTEQFRNNAAFAQIVAAADRDIKRLEGQIKRLHDKA